MKNIIDQIIEDLKTSMVHTECGDCECLQGYVVQLIIDCQKEKLKLDPFLVPVEHIHDCLGCSPCPPGKLYTDYLKRIKPNTRKQN